MVIYKPNNFILTGACCSGKTTAIDYIKSQGLLKTYSEKLKEVGKEVGIQKFVIPDIDYYINEVTKRMVKDFDGNNEKAVFDRGLPDNIVSFPLHGKVVGGGYMELCKKRRYNKNVFFFETLPCYDKDDHPFTFEQNEQMCEDLKKLYTWLGYRLIFVPIDTVENRVKMVLEVIL